MAIVETNVTDDDDGAMSAKIFKAPIIMIFTYPTRNYMRCAVDDKPGVQYVLQLKLKLSYGHTGYQYSVRTVHCIHYCSYRFIGRFTTGWLYSAAAIYIYIYDSLISTRCLSSCESA